jgi:hypothetical protein
MEGAMRKVAFILFFLSNIAFANEGGDMFIKEDSIQKTIATLAQKYGEGCRERIERGVRQVATLWREEDGTSEDFEAFCTAYFIPDESTLDVALERFERMFEAMSGHEVALTRTLREPIDLDMGENIPLDLLIASLNPFDHAQEDAFKTKVAFVALLNFPAWTQKELESKAMTLSRKEWAKVRLGQAYALRIPGRVKQKETKVAVEAGNYIDNYNIHLARLRLPSGEVPFPSGPKLISHWGLRDHIKALYHDPKQNLERQLLIQKVMERIILQEIPQAVINSDEIEWDPISNQVFKDGKRQTELEAREEDTRYRHILSWFKVEREIDTFSPLYPTYMSRQFDRFREIPEEKVEALLRSVLEDPVGAEVASLIRERLGRELKPFDIWYDGFKARGAYGEDILNKKVSNLFSSLEGFKKALPQVLVTLGFSKETAQFLAARIEVDPARGAGHAMGAGMRTDKAHLRTRVPKGGMDYKGFNIAMHELGHTVEQTFSLYKIDYILLSGVPNTAFTEAMAFIFQDRDLDVLGLQSKEKTSEALKVLDKFWMTREIAGVALVDMLVWRWLYEHEGATAEQLREAVVSIAKDVWNTYYAPVMNTERDSPLLAIYSHMIAYALYLPDYPLGHIIEFQIGQHLNRKNFGKEIERMCVQGRIMPEAWMMGAVGQGLSAAPMLDATRQAVNMLKKTKHTANMR